VAQGNTCWYSEPYGFDLFDLTRNYIAVDSRIRMVRPVRDGIFVGSESAVFFMAGANPVEGRMVKVCDYPVVEWSDCNFHGTFVVTRTGEVYVEFDTGELSAIWMSTKGVCYGGYDGDFRNMTDRKVDLPAANTGSGVVYKGRFIGLLNP